MSSQGARPNTNLTSQKDLEIIQALKEQISVLRSQVLELAKAEEFILELQKELERARASEEELESEVHKLRNEVAKASTISAVPAGSSNQEVQNLREQLARKDRELQQAIRDFREFQGRVAQDSQQKESLIKRLKEELAAKPSGSSQAARPDQTDRINDLEAKLKSMKDMSVRKGEEANQLAQENEALRAKVQELMDENARLSEEGETLIQKNMQMSVERGTLMEQKEGDKQLIRKLEKQAEMDKIAMQKLKSDLDASQSPKKKKGFFG